MSLDQKLHASSVTGILEGTSSELTVPLPKYSLQWHSFFLDKFLQDVTSPSGVWLLFPEITLVFQETFLHSNWLSLRLCSRRLCSSSWILICKETNFFLKCTEQTQFNWIQLETYPECKTRAFNYWLKTTVIQSAWKEKKIEQVKFCIHQKCFKKSLLLSTHTQDSINVHAQR